LKPSAVLTLIRQQEVSERVPLKQGLKLHGKTENEAIKNGFRESSIKTRIETLFLPLLK
jgi:hypothetical protein